MKKIIYKLIQKSTLLFFKKPSIYLPKDYDENTPSIFMCDHSQNYGPVMFAAHFPYKARPWAHSEVVNYDESFEYVRETFCIGRLKLKNNIIADIVARLIARPLVMLVNMNNPIAIYHDGVRDIRTFRESINSLVNNESQVIFAAGKEPLAVDGIVNPKFDFMRGYLLIVKQAMQRGVTPKVYPVSINKKDSVISIGEPIVPNKNSKWKDEEKRIHDYIVSEVKYRYNAPDRENNSRENEILLLHSKSIAD